MTSIISPLFFFSSRRPLLWLCAAFTLSCAAPAKSTDEIQIPYQRFVLTNGLTLLVHEDHKAPLVAVNLWYHVGSKNEQPGQTGFAHLFEHLMFNGSEHFDDEYFRPFEAAGATDMNGTTNNDRTNYFATVPTPALDMALWMESDRMANLLPAIDQTKLDEQRGVVKNEKRQREDRPFGRVWERIATNTYPAGHPYSWEVIGSMQDLDAATLDQVHAWFRNYYGPNNAVLVIAGDVETQAVLRRVEHYFGGIAPNPPLQNTQRWIAQRHEERRDAMQDRVSNARIYLVWNTPAFADRESNRLDLLADILAGDASGVLTRALVQERKIATGVSAYQMAREIGGQFLIAVDVVQGIDPLLAEKYLRDALQAFTQDSIDNEVLARAKTNYRAQFVRMAEKVGGFGGKTDVLASGLVLADDPAYYRRALHDVEITTPDQLRRAAQTWLNDGVYVLHVTPYPVLKAGADSVDRSRLPEPGAAPAPRIPSIERAQLGNGLQLLLMRRSGMPLVEMELQFGFGRFIDGLAAAGTTDFAMQMAVESSAGLDGGAIAERLRALGASIDAYATIDSAGVRLSALTDKLDASAELLAQLIQHPDPSADAVGNLQRRTLARIGREQTDAGVLVQRVLPRLLLGDTHPSAGPLSGSGTSAAIATLTSGSLEGFYRRHFTPAAATLIAVGDIDMAKLQALAERHFGQWQNPTAMPAAALPPAPPAAPAARLFFIDVAGGAQATISAATTLPPSEQLDMRALGLANAAFGGQFTSRINMNLREDKHWSYGTRSQMVESRGPQLWIAAGGVQSDKTAAALLEVRREWQELRQQRPLTSAELEQVREQRVRQLPGSYETNAELLHAVSKNLRLKRPDDYLAADSDRLRALDLASVQRQSAVLDPGSAVYLVVGDRHTVLPQLRELGWGAVIELDVDGNPIAVTATPEAD